MRAIKIILIIITLIVIGFLSIGLLVKETTYTTEVAIEKPLEYVFSEFNDVSKFKVWRPEFKSIKTIEEKLGQIGNQYEITVNNNGREIVMKGKILAFIPNEKVTLFYDARQASMLKTDDYVFSRKGDVTLISHKARCRSNSFLMACMFPVFKSKFKNQDQGYLNNLKTFLEKQ